MPMYSSLVKSRSGSCTVSRFAFVCLRAETLTFALASFSHNAVRSEQDVVTDKRSVEHLVEHPVEQGKGQEGQCLFVSLPRLSTPGSHNKTAVGRRRGRQDAGARRR